MFWQIAIRLVSQAPDNVVYHLFSLLSLTVGFSLALWQWRRNRKDEFAWRLMIATAAILLLRLIIPLVSAGTPANLRLLTIPPLERALDTAVIVFLIWALLPPLKSLPRLSDALLLLLLFSIGLIYNFAAQDWDTLLTQGLTYGNTNQAGIWSAAQLILLVAAALALIVTRPYDWILRILAFLPLAIASSAHIFNFAPNIPNFAGLAPDASQGNIAVWTRLAYMVTLPLVAVISQRHILYGLILGTISGRTLSDAVPPILNSASEVLNTNTFNARASESAKFAADLLNANFAALISASNSTEGNAPISTYEPNTQAQRKQWSLRLADWPGMQNALKNGEIIELLPNGLGARQLSDLKQELDLDMIGPMLIIPIKQNNGKPIGLLLLGADPNLAEWSTEHRTLLPSVTNYIASGLREFNDRGPTNV